ncbi:MAG: metallophosphoesterase [Lachnospiraceae bacterium]|nr:metallophosphoesterase [Lachnospiraceae bacterium]
MMKNNRIKLFICMIILSLPLPAAVFSMYANPDGAGRHDDPELMSLAYTEIDVSGNDGGYRHGDTGWVSGGDADWVSGGDGGRLLVQTVAGGYPMPDYDFSTEEITVHIDGLDREYTIAFVNDLHLITDHTSGDVSEDNLAVVENRYENLAVTPEGIHAEELWPEVVRYLNYNHFDAVIFGGDILDYGSNSNIMTLQAGLQQMKYPVNRMMYLRSDHDYSGGFGGDGFKDSDGEKLQTLLLDGDRQFKCIEFEDFIILGINRSYRNLSEDVYKAMKKKLELGKPVIIATHVPLYSEVDESLKETSLQVRNRIYYWSYDSGIYVPNRVTEQFIDEIYAEDSNVVQIVAAHMHASWDGYVTENIKEHIFAPSFEGQIGIIHVTGE